jgi:hypothetical protein
VDKLHNMSDNIPSYLIEDLRSCIEKCTVKAYTVSTPSETHINKLVKTPGETLNKTPNKPNQEHTQIPEETFYFDSRFGTVIETKNLHKAYMSCAYHLVKPVKAVEEILRINHTFYISVVNVDNSLEGIEVPYANMDKSFMVRTHDPRPIIAAILRNPDAIEYLQSKRHPAFNPHYIAQYDLAPDSTISTAEPSNIPTSSNERWYKRYMENLTQRMKEEKTKSTVVNVPHNTLVNIPNNDNTDTLSNMGVRRATRKVKRVETPTAVEEEINKITGVLGTLRDPNQKITTGDNFSIDSPIIYEDDFNSIWDNIDNAVYTNRPLRVQEPDSDGDSDEHSGCDSCGFSNVSLDEVFDVDEPIIDDADALDALAEQTNMYEFAPGRLPVYQENLPSPPRTRSRFGRILPNRQRRIENINLHNLTANDIRNELFAQNVKSEMSLPYQHLTPYHMFDVDAEVKKLSDAIGKLEKLEIPKLPERANNIDDLPVHTSNYDWDNELYTITETKNKLDKIHVDTQDKIQADTQDSTCDKIHVDTQNGTCDKIQVDTQDSTKDKIQIDSQTDIPLEIEIKPMLAIDRLEELDRESARLRELNHLNYLDGYIELPPSAVGN